MLGMKILRKEKANKFCLFSVEYSGVRVRVNVVLILISFPVQILMLKKKEQFVQVILLCLMGNKRHFCEVP